MSGPGRLVVISGPSGVGKTTVCERLLAGGGFVNSVSATTRAPRGAERDGVDYHFVDQGEFRRMIAAGELLEWAHVHGKDTYYGTPRGPVTGHLAAGRHVLLNIDVQGAAQLREQGLPLVTIFLLPPSREELLARLRGRGDTAPEEVERRLQAAERELAQAERYDHRVVNHELEETVREIRSLLAG